MNERARACKSAELSQFELSNILFQNVNKFDITPTTKLVLMFLASCYNPKKATVFPKEKTIALKIGVSERSVNRAIQELTKEGLIMYETKGRLNHYKFTAKIFALANMSDISRQNVIKKYDKLTHDNKQHEHKKNSDFSFNSNQPKGIDYPKAVPLNTEVRDERTHLNDKETALKFISDLLPMQDNDLIRRKLNEVYLKWNTDAEIYLAMGSFISNRIKYSSEI